METIELLQHKNKILSMRKKRRLLREIAAHFRVKPAAIAYFVKKHGVKGVHYYSPKHRPLFKSNV